MQIEIKREDITIEREQHNPDPGLGLCDVCRAAKATWEVEFGWNRKPPYRVPLSVSYAFICGTCHEQRDGTLEFIRGFIERQAKYLADRAPSILVQLSGVSE